MLPRTRIDHRDILRRRVLLSYVTLDIQSMVPRIRIDHRIDCLRA